MSELVQVVPPSVEYSVRYPVMRLPPSDNGVAQYKVAPLNDAYTANERGTDGGSRGRGLSTTVLLAGLVPVAFTALTRKVYAMVPLRPLIVEVLVADTPSLTVVQVTPSSTDDSMM